jgi:hypothetical protein
MSNSLFAQRVAGRIVGLYGVPQPGWAEEAVSPDDADVQAFLAPPVPRVVEMAQARLALLQAGLLTQVQSAIDAMPGVDGQAARIAWEYRATVRRDSTLVQALAQQLALTEEQLDTLFTTAAAL